MIELSLLRHFIAVAQTGSFTRAADQLNASLSVVSRSIKRLEEDVGAKLLERTTRNAALTPAGKAFLAEALAIVGRVAVAADNARRIDQGALARLRIGICPSTEAQSPLVARGLFAFRQAWPAVALEFRSAIGTAVREELLASQLDVGVLQLSRAARTDLECQVIARSPLMVAVPAVWNLGQTRVHLADLSERPWILPSPKLAPVLYERLVDLCRAAGFEPKVAAFAEDSLTSGVMIECGLGVAFVNASHDDRGRAGDIDLVALDDVPDDFVAEAVVAWAPGASSPQVGELARCVAIAASSAAGR